MRDMRLELPKPNCWSAVRVGHRRILFLLWTVFLLRAGFYGSFTPVWEGFDEHSHFAYIQLLSTEGRLPVGDRDRVSEEVHRSLQLVPLPWHPRGFGVGLTHDEYWKLDESERDELQARLKALDPSLARRQTPENESNSYLALYESQHPPLYYALCLIPYRLAAGMNLVDRVFLIRLWSVLIASALIPLAFFFLRQFLQDSHALLVVWHIVFLPGLMVDVVRVGNDSLAVVLFTLLSLLSVRVVSSRKHSVVIGLILGLGLLTKSSFLTAVVPIGVVLLLPRNVQRKPRTRLGDLCVAGLAALAASAWWYLLTHSVTGSWTGIYYNALIPESSSLAGVSREVDWVNAVKAVLSSHVWFGNWSFLKVRSWIYQLVILAFLVGLFGALIRVVQSWRRRSADRYPFFIAVLFYGFFWLGLGYHILLTFVGTGVSATQGWYLYTPIGCEVVLLVAGWSWVSRVGVTRVVAGATLGATLVDLYAALFLLLPYYTGYIFHDSQGSLASFRPWNLSFSDYAEVLSRLTVNKSLFMTSGYFLGFGILFVLVGISSLVLAVWLLRRGEMSFAFRSESRNSR